MIRSAVMALGLLCLATTATSQDSWDAQLFDPAAGDDVERADLVLPMPCGGAMAFQRVAIPMDATDPLADVEIRLGQTGSGAGYLDYLRNAFLRGSFTEEDGTATYFYLARYELTSAQHKVLTASEDCDVDISRRDRTAKGGVSWFEAIALSQAYTEWLHTNVPDAVPSEDGQRAFVRLPTEVEWEYAARGGAAVSPGEFSAIRFPMEETVDGYARYDRERPGPVGSKKPNPLSLFDMYGNLEEIVFDPFRLNAIGQIHGQAGGMVVRGGSYQTSGEQMRSSNRKEWPFYNRRGVAQVQDTFGVRFALAVHVGTSDTRVREIRDAWTATFESATEEDVSARATLLSYIDSELDPLRKGRLEEVLLALSEADKQAAEAAEARLQTTLRGATIFLTGIWDDTQMIGPIETFIADDEAYLKEFRDVLEPEDIIGIEENIAALKQALEARSLRRGLSLDGYREALEFLRKAEPEAVTTTLGVVRRGFEEADNRYLQSALDAAMDDFGSYMGSPDMEDAVLLDLAVER